MESHRKITADEFRSCYPDVSIQHLGDKALPKVAVVEKKTPAKSPARSTPRTLRQPPLIKTTPISGAKANLPSPKVNTHVVGNTLVQAKLTPGVQSLALPKTPVAIKTPINSNAQAVKTTVATNKTPVPVKSMLTPNKPAGPASQMVKTTPISSVTKTAKPATHPLIKQVVQNKTPIQKTPQNSIKQSTTSSPVVKQQTPNAGKGPSFSEKSSVTVLYNMPQRPNKQVTIEKIEPQVMPAVLKANSQMVLQQVITNNQVVLQSRVAPVEATAQSGGVSGQPVTSTVAPLPKVEKITSEPLQALQVNQHVTLFTPKGNLFTVDDVKRQISLKPLNTMTNVVSSTTNSTPPTPTPAVAPQQDPKKVVLPARSPTGKCLVRQTRQLKAPQYSSTHGQTRHVSPKRDIPMQKVLPLQPPTHVEHLANEEEVTTSEEMPQQTGQLIILLPSGEKKTVEIDKELPLNITLQEFLNSKNIELPGNTQATFTPEPEHVEGTWENTENVGSGSGGTLGAQDRETEEQLEPALENQLEEGESQKEPDTSNIPVLFREGFLAVCSFCGMASNNFSRCPRCSRPIPPDCKTIPSVSLQSRKTKADSLTADSPKKKRICKRRKAEEPVCLTISDDEELLGLSHHTHDSRHSDTNSHTSSCDKEPVITEDMVSELKHSISAGGGQNGEERLDNASPSERTYLQCRTVRIGSYKVVPKDKVLITPHGLKFTVPVLNSDQYVELKIMHDEIIKVLMHFGRQLPVLFFYTRPAAAAKVRKALRMEDKQGCYYDTTSSDQTHRRITFLPDKIDDECKLTLKKIFENPENNVYAELSGKEANDILVKASPKEVQAFIHKKLPNLNPQPPQPQPFDGQNIQTIMIYPPPPEKGGIPINTEDYACLGEDQFLNDVIIDFYLKYVVEKTLSPEDRARTHVFSSFFYKRLTTKPPAKRRSMNPVENDPTASAAAKRHSRVKSWTKNVNLFNKDFIVIPINESSHWYLAIVCFPGLTGPVRFSDNTPIELPARKKTVSNHSVMAIGSTTITQVHQNLDSLDDPDERDEADDKDELMDIPDCDEESAHIPVLPVPGLCEEDEENQVVKTKKQPREPIKQPCILIFDSLAGASRARVVATLRDYLRIEYEVKQGESRDFSGDVLKGSNVKCPQQTNYTDCGLYVLQYVEAFFQWPVTDYHIPIKQLQDWFQADIVSRKRYEIQQLLHRLMQEQNIDFETLNLPLLNLRPEGTSLVEYSGTEDEDEDDMCEEEDQMCEEEEDEEMMDGEEEYHDEMGDEHDDEMEEGEIGHHDHDDDDPDNYLDPNMEHEDHEMEEEDFPIDDNSEEGVDLPVDEDIDEEEELDEKELDDIYLTPDNIVKGANLKKYRIPRLASRMPDNSFKDDQ